MSSSLFIRNAVKAAFSKKPQQGSQADPYWPYVVSQLEFDDGLFDECGKVWTTAGNAAVSGGDLLLDGNSDYVWTPTNTSINLGTGDFTIEIVVTTPSASSYQFLFGADVNASGYMMAAINAPLSPTKTLALGRASISWPCSWSGGSTIQNNTKHHIEFSRVSGINYAFIDGVSAGAPVTDSTDWVFSNLRIGSQSGGTDFNGKIHAWRVTKGVGRHTANFTPPTSFYKPTNADYYWPYVVSHLEFDNGLVDAKGLVWTASGDATISNGELVLDGAGDWISTPQNAAFNFGTGDWTIEGFIEYTTNVNGTLVSSWDISQVADSAFEIVAAGGTQYFQVADTVSQNAAITTTPPSTGVRKHFAMCRIGNSVKAFIGGVQVGSTINPSFSMPASVHGVRIGGRADGGAYPLYGKVAGFRTTKGVARYIANFTPPTSFPAPTYQDIYWPYVVSLLNFDNGLTDDKGRSWTTIGNATVSNGSLITDASGDAIETTGADLNLTSTTPATIEGFITATNLTQTTYGYIFSLGTDGGASSGNYLTLYRPPNTSGLTLSAHFVAEQGLGVGLVNGVKSHWAVCLYADGTCAVYIDGVRRLTQSRNGKNLTGPLRYGQAYWHAGQGIEASHDATRYTIGIARYVGANVTPPTSFTAG